MGIHILWDIVSDLHRHAKIFYRFLTATDHQKNGSGVHLGLEEDNQNFLLMHAIGVNVSGQIASVIAGGLILALVKAQMGG